MVLVLLGVGTWLVRVLESSGNSLVRWEGFRCLGNPSQVERGPSFLPGVAEVRLLARVGHAHSAHCCLRLNEVDSGQYWPLATLSDRGAIMRYASSLVFVLVFLAIVSAAPAVAFDPQSIVGSWEGTWSAGQGNGAYYINIKKVIGNQAEGTLYIDGSQRYHKRDIPFTGTLDGPSLSLKDVPTLPGSPMLNQFLKISDDGTSMEGEGVGTVRATFSLRKK